MNLFILTFEAVFILLGIGVIGFWFIARHKVPGATLSFLSTLATDIALPFLVLSNLIRDFSTDKFTNWWHMPLWWFGFTAISLILSLAASFMVKKDIRSEFTISLLYQNGIFFPLIIINGIFGPQSSMLSYLFIFMALHPSFVFSTYPLFFNNRNVGGLRLNIRRVINPVLVASVIGLVIGLFSVSKHIPGFITSIITMVGAMATPLFMLILGGNVYNDFKYSAAEKSGFRIVDVMKFVIVKNILFPLVYLGLLLLLGPDKNIAFIIMLQSAVPPITAIPIFAERCNGNRAVASQFVVGSFVFSILSIPLMLYLFDLFFMIKL